MLKLFIEGWTQREIAAKFKIHFSNVSRGISAELDDISKVTEGRAKHLRALQLAKLDRMERALWPLIDQGDTQSILAGLKVMERRARLLGLDLQPEVAPQVNLNLVNFNDPKMQFILNRPESLELLYRLTESTNGNGHHAGETGGGGLAALTGHDGGEAGPELPPLPPRTATEPEAD